MSNEAEWWQGWKPLDKKARGLEAEAYACAARTAERLGLGTVNWAYENKETSAQLSSQLQHVNSSLRPLKQMQHSDKVEHLAPMIDEVEQKVSSLKHTLHSSLEQLEQSERTLDKAVAVTNNSLAQLEQPPAASEDTLKPKMQQMQCQRSALHTATYGSDMPEVTELETFVHKHGGWCGGWDERDHRQFKRALASVNCDYSQLPDLVVNGHWPPLAHMSRRDIIEHCRFDQELERLKALKRAAVESWRMQKQAIDAERKQQLAKQSAEEERERKEAERRKQQRLERERKQRLERVRCHREQMLEAKLQNEHRGSQRCNDDEEQPCKSGRSDNKRSGEALEEINRRAQHRKERMNERKPKTREEKEIEAARRQQCSISVEHNLDGTDTGSRPSSSDRESCIGESSSSASDTKRALRRSAQEAIKTGKKWAEQRENKRDRSIKPLPAAPATASPIAERDPNRLVQPTAASASRGIARDGEQAGNDSAEHVHGVGAQSRGPRRSAWLQQPMRMQHRAIPAWTLAA